MLPYSLVNRLVQIARGDKRTFVRLIVSNSDYIRVRHEAVRNRPALEDLSSPYQLQLGSYGEIGWGNWVAQLH